MRSSSTLKCFRIRGDTDVLLRLDTRAVPGEKNGEFQGTDEICFNANCKRTGVAVIDQFCIYTICTLRTINYV